MGRHRVRLLGLSAEIHGAEQTIAYLRDWDKDDAARAERSAAEIDQELGGMVRHRQALGDQQPSSENGRGLLDEERVMDTKIRRLGEAAERIRRGRSRTALEVQRLLADAEDRLAKLLRRAEKLRSEE